MNVKICGLSRQEDIAAVNEAKADYAGFVFFEKSKRNVSLKKARELISRLSSDVQSVAVCVSPSLELIRQMEDIGCSIIQIHGDISEALLNEIHLPVWQALNISGGIKEANFFKHPKITGYVIDAAEYGSGKTFGWEDDPDQSRLLGKQIREQIGEKQFILAGGLHPGNVAQAAEIFSPDVVDVSSGVEHDGHKARDLILSFVRSVT